MLSLVRRFDPFPRRTPAGRWVAGAQLALFVGLMSVALWWSLTVSRRATVLFTLIPVVFLPFSYARLRLHAFLEAHLRPRQMLLFLALGLLCDLVMAVQAVFARSEPPGWLVAPGINWVGAVWFSAHALLLLGFLAVGILRLGGRGVKRAVGSGAAETALPGVDGLSRRELLQKAGLVGVAVPFGISLSSVPLVYDFRIEEREIRLPHWPRALDGLRVVHLSDIHVGGAMDRAHLSRVAELANRCRPDLVLHTGDFLTHRQGDFDEPLYEALASIRAPYGQWACLGNHDYDDLPRLLKRMGDAGVTVLQDRTRRLEIAGEPLEIAGLDFVFDRLRRDRIYRATVDAWQPREGARILLNHDPTGFAQMPAGCADLVLSGHTHGGHIGVQLDSSHAITVVGLAGIPDQGIFERGGMRMYVTRCVGFYGYPMRIGIPPEIALLTLRSA